MKQDIKENKCELKSEKTLRKNTIWGTKKSFYPKALIEKVIMGREKTLSGRLLVVNFYRSSVALSKAALSWGAAICTAAVPVFVLKDWIYIAA